MKNRGKKVVSLFEIWLLVSMSFALAFLLGSEIKTVSADIAKNTGYIKNGENVLYVTAGTQIPNGAIIYPTANAANIGTTNPTPAPVTTTTTSPNIGTVDPNAFNQKSTSMINPSNAGSLVGTGLTLSKSGSTTAQQGAGAGATAAGASGASGAEAAPYKGCVYGTDFLCANGAAGYLVTGLKHAALMIAAAQIVGSVAGLSTKNTQALTLALTAGSITRDTIVALKGLGGIGEKTFVAQNAGLIGVVVAIAVFVATYKKEKQQLVNFQCLPWEPPLGGASCEQCNSDPLKPCSEYRCKSLGQACQLLNAGTNNEKCAWVNPKDVTSPTITEWDAALKPTSLVYNPSPATRPGARGVKIVSNEADGCLPAFTPLQFGVLTNEPAQCKIDFNRTDDFEVMKYYFGDSNYYEYNHTQVMRLPSPNSADSDLSPLLQNDGTFSMFVRCRDANGNANVDEYSINFCVSAGPDTTPPIIEGSSITDGSPVQSGADSTPIEIYVNEPAVCKWSKQDREFTDMENTMNCPTEVSQVNSNLQYTCSSNLTGIADMENNSFYFRCKDQPNAPEASRNVMVQSYNLNLMGTEGLAILSVGPNSTITASTSSVPIDLNVETAFGASDGKAICRFSASGVAGSYIDMYKTNAPLHSQPLSLSAGNYTYFIRCVDAGGNLVDTNTTFSVSVDTSPPVVSRIYKEGADLLKIITNEDAQCAYSLNNCNYDFKDGIKFSYQDTDSQILHTTAWKTNTPYYIKCRDGYGNEPNPSTCSVIVTGLNLGIKAKNSG